MAGQSRAQPARLYLLAYNTICAIIWARILLTTITTLIASDVSSVYALEPWTRFAQTLAVAEIIHAATGSLPQFLSAELSDQPNRHCPLPRIHHLYPGVCPLGPGVGDQLCFPRCDEAFCGVCRYVAGLGDR